LTSGTIRQGPDGRLRAVRKISATSVRLVVVALFDRSQRPTRCRAFTRLQLIEDALLRVDADVEERRRAEKRAVVENLEDFIDIGLAPP